MDTPAGRASGKTVDPFRKGFVDTQQQHTLRVHRSPEVGQEGLLQASLKIGEHQVATQYKMKGTVRDTIAYIVLPEFHLFAVFPI